MTRENGTRNEILSDCQSKGGFREIDAGDQSGRPSGAQRPSGDARRRRSPAVFARVAAVAAIAPADHSQLGDRTRQDRQSRRRAPRTSSSTRRPACTARRSTRSSSRSIGCWCRCSRRSSTFSRPAIFSRCCWPRKRCATNRPSSPWSACASIRAPARPPNSSAFSKYDLPVLTHLRTTQLYVQTTMHGMTMFDLSASRAAKDLEQWQPIIDWVNS
jgi:hypothetical protein